MSNSKPSAASFWIFAGLVTASFAMTAVLAWPAVTSARHSLERSLMDKGRNQKGVAAIAWYQAAADLAPHDPTPAINLARLLWGQGSGDRAAAVLTRYKAPEAVVLRGQYLVQLERFDEAERILGPLQGDRYASYWGNASHWMGIALAEQGKVREAIITIEPPWIVMDTYRESPLGLLEEEVWLTKPGENPGQLSPEVIADNYAKWGMIRSAQRVLAENHVTSASSWILRAQLDQAVVKVNWQEVESDYQQALAADPSNADVRKALRQVAQRNNDKAELQKLDELEQLLPGK